MGGNILSFSIRQLKYFITTAETGQVSLAALQLSISQSAVTTSIKELEQIIGVPLFVRTAHGVELTSIGRDFLSYAYEITAKIDEALHINLYNNDLSGTLTIAATYTVIGYLLPLHIERLMRLFPKLQIQIFEQSRQEIETGLIDGQFDLGILLTSNIENQNLSTETMLSSPRRLWVGANHPLLEKENVTLKDISAYPYIMLTVDEADISALRYWKKTPFLPNILLKTSSVEAVRSMVANGLGVSILSDMISRQWSLEGRRIKTINIQKDIDPMNIGLAWKNSQNVNPSIQILRSYFINYFKQ